MISYWDKTYPPINWKRVIGAIGVITIWIILGLLYQRVSWFW